MPHTIVVDVFRRSSSAEFVRFWARAISFLFWPGIAILYGTVELLTETPGSRNRLTLLAAEYMTSFSSSNIALLRSKAANLSFADQELSNGALISTVRPSQQKLSTRLTKLTVRAQWGAEEEAAIMAGYGQHQGTSLQLLSSMEEALLESIVKVGIPSHLLSLMDRVCRIPLDESIPEEAGNDLQDIQSK